MLGEIDGKRDLLSGGAVINAPAKSNQAAGKCFTSITYTVDGSCLLAGGKSHYICLYEISQRYEGSEPFSYIARLLLRKFKATSNQSFDGVITNMSLLKDLEVSMIDAEEQAADDRFVEVLLHILILYRTNIPGAKRPESFKRKLRPVFLYVF